MVIADYELFSPDQVCYNEVQPMKNQWSSIFNTLSIKARCSSGQNFDRVALAVNREMIIKQNERTQDGGGGKGGEMGEVEEPFPLLVLTVN